MARRRTVRQPLTVERILSWADEHYDRTGQWPQVYSGLVHAVPGERWRNVHNALRYGLRGLPGGSSLPQLLATQRGYRNPSGLPPLTEAMIEERARCHRGMNLSWPTEDSGPVLGTAGESWDAVNAALREGLRGLPGGSSLAQFLADRLGVRTRATVPPLTVETILGWADDFHARHGRWPTTTDGPVGGAPGETWNAVQSALYQGARGLPGGSSLARLLQEHRGYRNKGRLPTLAVETILGWADAYHARHGRWPTPADGPIDDAPHETWRAVQSALDQGARGLPGGDSLAQLLQRHRGRRNKARLPALTVEQIRAWMVAHKARMGRWPTEESGPVAESPGDSWKAVAMALIQGLLGLPGGDSLARLREGGS